MPSKPVYDILGEIREQLARMEAQNETYSRQLEDHHYTLYGNGRVGLTTAVDRLEAESKRWHHIVSAWWALTVIVTGQFAWILFRWMHWA